MWLPSLLSRVLNRIRSATKPNSLRLERPHPGATENVGNQVSWSSSNTDVATVNTAGLATAVGPGTATVTALLTNIDKTVATGTATLTVTAPTGGSTGSDVTSLTIIPSAQAVASPNDTSPIPRHWNDHGGRDRERERSGCVELEQCRYRQHQRFDRACNRGESGHCHRRGHLHECRQDRGYGHIGLHRTGPELRNKSPGSPSPQPSNRFPHRAKPVSSLRLELRAQPASRWM